ncbi:HAD family hydrolase [Candidatus Woesearchaeota archaeon]|nr:HAD family hydrolase [Candidatus Woesearchaeota archaeon]
MNRAIFLDRDGTLNHDDGYTYKVEHFKLLPGVIEGLKLLKNDFIFFIVTNQSGVARGYYGIEDVHKFNNVLLKLLKDNGILIKEVYICPHHPDDRCDCRKPGTKFASEAKAKYNIDMKNSWVIGDHPWDVEMGIRAGCRTIYLLTGHGGKHRAELEKNKINPEFIAENLLEAARIIIKEKR